MNLERKKGVTVSHEHRVLRCIFLGVEGDAKRKMQWHSIYIVTNHILQLQRRCATQTGLAYSLGHSLNPTHTHNLCPAATRSPSLPFNGLHPIIHVITCNTQFSFTNPRGTEG